MQFQEITNKLALPKPWKVQKIDSDQIHKHLIVELGCELKKRSLFNTIKDVVCPLCKQQTPWPTTVQYLTIRHISADNYKVYLRIPHLKLTCMQTHVDCPMRLYSNPKVPYSYLLEQKIREFWNVPNGAMAAATALQLDVDELEQLIEYGWLPRAGMIPPPSHPIWLAVITNRIPFKTQNLGLQCLLTWAKGQLQRSNLADNDRLTKISMVRSYFEKYRTTLQSELDQILNTRGIL